MPNERLALPVGRLCAVGLTTALLIGCTAGSPPGAAPEESQHGGLYSIADAQALAERWDNIDGWFGGELMRYGSLNVDRLYEVATLPRVAPMSQLREAARPDVAAFVVNTQDRGRVGLDDYVAGDDRIDGFLVLHGGEIVYERYVMMRPDDKHIWMSVSKMLTGLVISELQDDGRIEVERPVNDYVPELGGTSWEGVTVRNVLDMASGTGCAEDLAAYRDIESCFTRIDRSLGWHPDRPLDFRTQIAAAPFGYDQGTRYEYTSANTNLLMYVAEAVTGKTYPELVSELVWAHIGAEHDGLIMTGDYAAGGAAAASAGMFTTLRDLGRFGLFMLQQESFQQKLMDDARPTLKQPEDYGGLFDSAGEQPTHNAWQVDEVFADGDFGKSGFGGQYLYVSPQQDLVVAYFGTFDEALVRPDLKSVARQLSSSGMFER